MSYIISYAYYSLLHYHKPNTSITERALLSSRSLADLVVTCIQLGSQQIAQRDKHGAKRVCTKI